MTEDNFEQLLKHIEQRIEALHEKTNDLQGDMRVALDRLEAGGKVLAEAAPLLVMAKTWASTTSKFKGFLKR